MIIILLFLLITFAFVIWPAFSRLRQDKAQRVSQEAENLRLYQQRKEEILSADYSEDEREQMLLELDYELVNNQDDAALASDASPKLKIITAMTIFVVMVSGVMFIYKDMGAQDQLVATQLLNKMQSAKLTDEEQQTLIKSLKVSAQNEPENTEWLYLYSRMQFSEGKYQESVAGFERLLANLPLEAKADRAASLVQIAQGKFYIAEQQASDSIYDYLKRALLIEPNNSQALGLAGIIAFELGQLENALTHWKALWFNMSSSPEAAALEQGIQRIAKQLQDQGQTVDLSWMKRAEVKVLVSITEELKAQLDDSDAVFIMAKALTGPVMPLAAMKVMAKDLPQEVVLDDSLGMVPGLALNQFDEVQVIARVAKGGQPMANAGDFQGVVKPVTVKSEKVAALVIDQVVE
jgi:cytochrome c-type biogenesis protein CcmH